MSTPDDRGQRVRIRRSPKFAVFLIIGAALGVLAALIITTVAPTEPNSDSASTIDFSGAFGYLAIVGVFVGALVGSLAALIFDRVLRRGAKTVSVTVDRLEVPDQEPAADPSNPDDR